MIYRIWICGWIGRGGGLLWSPMCLPFNTPRVKTWNHRGRFYFTEKGWDLYGRDICKDAANFGYKNGYNFRVIKRKNPRRSEIVYRDNIQVVLLPPSGNKKYRDKLR